MENKEQVYSIDGSDYMNWENLMDELRESHNDGEEVEVWEADKVISKHADFIHADGLIYDMQANAMDECGEVAEEYLDDLTEEQKIDLELNIEEWFNKNSKVKFCGVENPRKIVVVVE